MKRFLVFAGDRYYPKGGANDYLADFSTKAEADAFAAGFVAGESLRWANILDTGKEAA